MKQGLCRGGAFSQTTGYLPVAHLLHGNPFGRTNDGGFRVVKAQTFVKDFFGGSFRFDECGKTKTSYRTLPQDRFDTLGFRVLRGSGFVPEVVEGA
jgi:hypothetical protein